MGGPTSGDGAMRIDSEFIFSDELPPVEHCTSAFVIAFDDEERTPLSHVLARGYDLVGGHIDPLPHRPGEREHPETTVVREAGEETGVEVGDLVLIGYKRLHVTNPPADYKYPVPVSYMPFYAGRILSVGERTAVEECGEPRFVRPAEASTEPALLRHWGAYAAAYERVVGRPLMNGLVELSRI